MGWLDTLFPQTSKGRKLNLPSVDVRDIKLPASWTDFSPKDGPGQDLPNASVIYGVGAMGIFVYALYSFFTGSWLTALFLLCPAAALFGFALHYLRHPSS